MRPLDTIRRGAKPDNTFAQAPAPRSEGNGRRVRHLHSVRSVIGRPVRRTDLPGYGFVTGLGASAATSPKTVPETSH